MKREEAINIVRKNIPHLGIGAAEMTEALNELIPDLKESEDERIRKALIEALKTAKTVGELKFTLPEPTREECIAYLERQKKIIDSITALKITIRPDGGIERPTIGYLEKQEQKPTPDWMPKFLDELRSMKNYFDWDEHRDIEGHILAIINWIAPNYFEEKEQKPRIEICPHSIKSKSYRDNGVPIESISDELVGIIKGVFEGFRRLLKKKGIDYEPQYGYWEGFARLFDSSAREYVKEQKPAVSREEILHQLFQNGSITLSNYLYLTEEQKHAWSEEDERMLHIILTDINYAQKNYSSSRLTPYDKKVSWLKALSMNLKKKNEDIANLCSNKWNEEDEAIVKFYEDDCNYRIDKMPMKDVVEMRLKFKDWVTNRIRYIRPSWKPSEEQMEALHEAVIRSCSYEYGYELGNLELDLKKL